MSEQNGPRRIGELINLAEVRRRMNRLATDREARRFIDPFQNLDVAKKALDRDVMNIHKLMMDVVGEQMGAGISPEEWGRSVI